MKKRLMALLLAVLMVSMALAGCGSTPASSAPAAEASSTPAESTASEPDSAPASAPAISDRTVVVVTSGLGLPYSLLEDDEWTGIDADMWAEIGSRTGWTIEVKQASFDSLFGELDSQRGDVAANCFAIKEERSAKYYPSIPYYGDAQCLAVKGDNEDINTMEDLAGKKVGVTSGQASETILEDMSAEYGFELVIYESLNVGYADVDLGRLDVMGGPVTGVNQYAEASGQTLRILDEKLLANNVGYYFPQTDEGKALCDEVNKVIQEMLDDGTCGEITEKWLFEDMTAYIN